MVHYVHCIKMSCAAILTHPFFLKGFMGGNVSITFPVSEAVYNFLMAFY